MYGPKAQYVGLQEWPEKLRTFIYRPRNKMIKRCSLFRAQGCPIYTNWYDPYMASSFSHASGESYGSWNNGFRVVPLVNCINVLPAPVRLVRVVRVVKQWLTSRSVGELYIIRETWKSVCTTRATRTTLVQEHAILWNTAHKMDKSQHMLYKGMNRNCYWTERIELSTLTEV